jgi:hypothetical protein
MSAAQQQARRDTSLEELLTAGRDAFRSGDKDSAHEIWRMAAVANPYDERVWAALMEVLTRDDDREVCLENIIAINPLNPDARRQLRAIRRGQRLKEEEDSFGGDDLDDFAPVSKRQLRAQKRAARMRAEAEADGEPDMTDFAPFSPIRPVSGLPRVKPFEPEVATRERSTLRAVVLGILIGLFAVVLGLIVSGIIYSGLLASLTG